MQKNPENESIESPHERRGLGKAKTLIEAAYNSIKEMIFQQKLISGQRLIYRDLSCTLHMSRTPIINALNRLEQEGYVASETFRGFYVKPIDLQEAWNLFGVREAIEAYAVELAIDRGEPDEITRLEEMLKSHEQYMPPVYDKKKALLDAQFHLQIATMAKNSKLRELLKSNLEHIYLRFSFEAADPNRMYPAVAEHHDLLDRIKRKDVAGSIEMMRLHVRKARNAIISGISKEKGPLYKLD